MRKRNEPLRSKMSLPVTPVRRKSVPEEVIHQLKSLIDAGHLERGDRLPGEREMAQMMNVSRPSLREALRVLSLLGVIEHRPGSGTYLTASAEGWSTEPLSILFLLKKSTLFEIFEARKILEGGVAALAAIQRSEEDLQSMEEALRNMKLNLGQPERYTKYELEFHHAVIEAAGNSVIADLMEKLYALLRETRTRIYQKYSLRIKAYRNQDYRYHEAIFDAIRKGNEERASKTMSDHLKNFEQRLKDEQLR
jgi:GntR family transcriptional repressor for pyruvate dehydrogenase complex